MFKLACDKCGGQLALDNISTIHDFQENIRYEIIESGSLINKDIPLYSYYVCTNCNESYKLTPIEFDRKVREFITEMALKMKRARIMEQINWSMVDQDSGLEYCGQCQGYDEKGNCLVDIIKQCPLLREKRKNEKLSTRRD